VILGWELPVAVTGGAVAGTGAFLLVREFLPATPSLGPALARLQPGAVAAASPPRPTIGGSWGWLARFVAVPRRDLAILGKGPEEYLTSIGISATAGLALPVVLALLAGLAGFGAHPVVPAVVGPSCAALFALIAHHDLQRKATLARREFGRALCTYLDLVILELTAAGPVQALERAAKTCHGWVFDRLDHALTQAQVQMVFPWDQLRVLADDIGVIELHDFAAVMRSAGDAGAHVQQTLHEQVHALRDRQRTDALTRAENVSARLEMPAALLVIVLAIFVIYPLIARLG